MAGSFQNRKAFFAISDIFMRAADWNTPVENSDINRRHPQLTPSMPTNEMTREKTPDCSGEYFIEEELTSRLKRFRFGFYTSAQLAAGWLALAQGAAAAPSGSQANEVQTLTVTGDPWTVTFAFEGKSNTTGNLAQTGITAAQVQTALNDLKSVQQGGQNAANVAVTGSTGGPFTVTFQNKLQRANVPAFTGTNVTIATTTPGGNNFHAITRSTSDQPPITSLIYGFEGDTDNPRKLEQVVVNEVTISGQIRGKVMVEVDLLATWPVDAGAYSVPECINFKPIAVKDCTLSINSTWIGSDLREFRYTYSNNIITGEDAFPFDDIDAIRLERGDRTSSFAFVIYGSDGDAMYELAEAEGQHPVRLNIGRPGDRVSIVAPSTKLRLQDTPTTFIGDANRSAINIDGEPFLSGAGTPDNVEAYLDQATAFLTT